MVLHVDSAGGYSLRGRPEGKQADRTAGRDLLAAGVVRAEGIVAVLPAESSAEH